MKNKILIILGLLILTIGPVCADGFIITKPIHIIVPPQRPFSPFVLEVKYHHVDVSINDQTATTAIDQVFYNPTSRRVEGEYIFPVPKGAAIKKFSMYINGKETPAELLDAKKARKIYEDIVRKMKDPALLEYQEMALFRARIFPIEPYSKKRVKISYHEVLKKDNGTIEYSYPLNTEKFSKAPLKQTRINIKIESSDKIKTVYCPTHDAEIIRKSEKEAQITYEENNTKPDTDFKIYYNTDKSKVGLSLLTYREEDENGFFLMNIAPSLDLKQDDIEEKDITFVLDSSGSMSGDKMKQAKKALFFCINNLNKGDRFQIIRFSTEAEALFSRLMKVDERSLKSARQFIQNMQAMGGTNIEEALSMALGKKNMDRRHIVVFMTDGKPTIGEIKEERLLRTIKKNNRSNVRIFTFGIGAEINTHLLDKITELTKAYRTYIGPQEDIEIKVSNFYQKIQSPMLTDLKIYVKGKVKLLKLYPKDLPDLFKGSSVSVIGRYKRSGNVKVVLEGRLKGKKRKFTYKTRFYKDNQKHDFIPPLWASRRIGYLLDQIRLHGEDKELVDEVTKLAREYGVITPYTSYLILEDEKVRISRNEIDDLDQTLGAIPASESIRKKSKKEYEMSKDEKSGNSSVRASEEFQALNKAFNFAQTRQGSSRLNYKDKEGKNRNIVQQVKNVQGRAFYNSGKFWVDAKVQRKRNKKVKRIKFASKKYFKLLKKYPEAGQYLSLGQNVRFVHKEKVYEIYE